MAVQLTVSYLNGQTRHHAATPGWSIDASTRCLVIGRGLPRTYIPLDQVDSFTVETIRPAERAPAADQPAVICRGYPPPPDAAF